MIWGKKLEEKYIPAFIERYKACNGNREAELKLSRGFLDATYTEMQGEMYRKMTEKNPNIAYLAEKFDLKLQG